MRGLRPVTRCATISSRSPGQAARIPERPAAVDRDLDRDRMQHLALGRRRRAPRPVEQQLEVGLADARPVQRAGHAHVARLRPPAAQRQHDLAQGLAGLLLGLVQRRQHRGLGRLGVDDLAALQALGDLIAAAEQLHALTGPRPGDVAAELARCRRRARRTGAAAPGAVADQPAPSGRPGRRGHARGSLPGPSAASGNSQRQPVRDCAGRSTVTARAITAVARCSAARRARRPRAAWPGRRTSIRPSR